jgi:hypothetical protein
MTRQTLTLKARQEFRCLAERCPDHCCGRWLVTLNDDTLARWSRIEPASLREQFLRRVVPLDVNGELKQVLAKNADNNCVNLTADGLCELQSACGHEYLPVTCQDFPRLRIANEWREFQTAELSCPEVARILVESDAAVLVGDRQTGKIQGDDPTVAITRALDGLFNMVYAEGRYAWSTRVYYLAWKILQLLQAFEQTGVQHHLLKFPRKQIRAELQDCRLSRQRGHIHVPADNAERFWRLSLEMLGDARSLDLPGIDYSDPLVKEIFSPDTDGADIYASIQALRKQVAAEVRRCYRPVMDKYIPVLFMNRGLPWNPFSLNLVATFINAAIPLALSHLILCLHFRQHGGMDGEFLQQLIYKIERRLKHTTTLYDRLDGDLSLLEIHRRPEIYLEIV